MFRADTVLGLPASSMEISLFLSPHPKKLCFQWLPRHLLCLCSVKRPQAWSCPLTGHLEVSLTNTVSEPFGLHCGTQHPGGSLGMTRVPL